MMGDYSLGNVVQTVSPSMDIQVASNFERYLYYLFDEEPARVREAFSGIREKRQDGLYGRGNGAGAG